MPPFEVMRAGVPQGLGVYVGRGVKERLATMNPRRGPVVVGGRGRACTATQQGVDA